MRLLPRCRSAAARHPLAYWAVIALLGCTAVGGLVHDRARVTAARRAWGATRLVVVAVHDLAPGDPPLVRSVELPLAAVAHGALGPDDVPAAAVVVQHVAAGEALTSFDLGLGPLALLPDGWIALAVRADPLPRLAPGDRVQLLTAEGVLADAAVVVEVGEGVVTVGLPAALAPAVADAERLQLLTVGLVSPR